MPTNYYKFLEISRDHTEHQLKAAFRRMTLRYHPDRNLGGESDFINLNTASEVPLSFPFLSSSSPLNIPLWICDRYLPMKNLVIATINSVRRFMIVILCLLLFQYSQSLTTFLGSLGFISWHFHEEHHLLDYGPICFLDWWQSFISFSFSLISILSSLDKSFMSTKLLSQSLNWYNIFDLPFLVWQFCWESFQSGIFLILKVSQSHIWRPSPRIIKWVAVFLLFSLSLFSLPNSRLLDQILIDSFQKISQQISQAKKDSSFNINSLNLDTELLEITNKLVTLEKQSTEISENLRKASSMSGGGYAWIVMIVIYFLIQFLSH